jgi:hypothetical protein
VTGLAPPGTCPPEKHRPAIKALITLKYLKLQTRVERKTMENWGECCNLNMKGEATERGRITRIKGKSQQ